MMRRYVQYEKAAKTLPKKSKKSRVQTLSDEEIQSLPAHLIQDLSTPPIKKLPSKKLEPVKDCVEDVFRNHRHPGSKTISFRRIPKQPLRTIDDTLARVNVVSKEEDLFSFRGHTFHMITWKYVKDSVQDVNTHLMDYNVEPEPVEYHHVSLLKLVSETTSAKLLETPAGRVCPNCKTSEFIRSDLKNMPVSVQDANWYNRDSFGEFCEQCGCLS